MSQQLPLSGLVSRDFTGNPSAQASSPAKRSARQAATRVPPPSGNMAKAMRKAMKAMRKGHKKAAKGIHTEVRRPHLGKENLTKVDKLDNTLTIQLRPSTLSPSLFKFVEACYSNLFMLRQSDLSRVKTRQSVSKCPLKFKSVFTHSEDVLSGLIRISFNNLKFISIS